MTIGSRIKQRRTSLKMTQQELGELTGYSKSGIAKIEASVNDIPRSKVRVFAEALRTSVGYILGIEDDANAPSSDQYFDYRYEDGTSFTISTDNARLLSNVKKWQQNVKSFEFNDNEMEEMMNYAKFIMMKRK